MTVTSIFNDIIGPVMRGPSSSHSAAGCRIGLLLRDLMESNISFVQVDYDTNGALATSHESQGTDMGLYGGLLGWMADDERLPSYRQALSEENIKIEVNYAEYNASHPNTYRITAANNTLRHSITAISTGGGMVEIEQIDGTPVSICGDYHELLIFTDDPEQVRSQFPGSFTYDYFNICIGENTFIELKSSKPYDTQSIKVFRDTLGVKHISYLRPVLPVLSRKNLTVPFLTCEEMLEIGTKKGMSLWQLALMYECQRSELNEDQVFHMMIDLIRIMKKSVETGLAGTRYEDRILHCQSVNFKEKMDRQELLGGNLLNTIILYVCAIMEVKSSFGVIVAAPTAGSCGALPGTILGAGQVLGKSDEDMAKAMLAASAMGIFISEHASFAGEVGGCQAECGSGSSMAAAGLVTLAGGDLRQSVAAASLALQNVLGLVCDPIGNRVEAPCLGRNVLAATNAVSCANMGIANFDPIVTYDEVVSAMYDVGSCIKHELRCTAKGGLSITKTSKGLEKKFSNRSLYE